MQEIKKYESAGRMILTGTPLHVGFYPSVCEMFGLALFVE
jgi:hypothetical protein